MEKGRDQESIHQVPQPIQDTVWESNKYTTKRHIQSQDISPFPAGDHKDARHRQDTMAKANTNKNIHKRSTTLERSVRKLLAGLN